MLYLSLIIDDVVVVVVVVVGIFEVVGNQLSDILESLSYWLQCLIWSISGQLILLLKQKKTNYYNWVSIDPR